MRKMCLKTASSQAHLTAPNSFEKNHHDASLPFRYRLSNDLVSIVENLRYKPHFDSSMEPHERIRYVFYNLLQKLLTSIGHNFLANGSFKPNAYSFFLYGLNALGFTSCVYTVISYGVSTGLSSICYGAINFQVNSVKNLHS